MNEQTRTKPSVRRARLADAAAIAAFNRSMARETEELELDPSTVEAGVHAVIDDPARGFYLVAERAGEPVGGLLVTYEWSDWRNAFFWWIQSVYVEPEHRGQGVYRALHEAVRRLASAEGGVCGLRLYVERQNEGARRTYEALGMRPSPYRLYEEIFPS